MHPQIITGELQWEIDDRAFNDMEIIHAFSWYQNQMICVYDVYYRNTYIYIYIILYLYITVSKRNPQKISEWPSIAWWFEPWDFHQQNV